MSAENKAHSIPWFLLPIWWLWKLVTGIMALTGRLIAIILGLVLMLVGVLLTVTVVGAILGIPLFLIGLLLVFRGLF